MKDPPRVGFVEFSVSANRGAKITTVEVSAKMITLLNSRVDLHAQVAPTADIYLWLN